MRSRRTLQRHRRFLRRGLPPETLRAVVTRTYELLGEHGLSLPAGTGDFADLVEQHAADDHLLYAREGGQLTWLALSRAATCAVHAADHVDLLRQQLIGSIGTQLAWLTVVEEQRRHSP